MVSVEMTTVASLLEEETTASPTKAETEKAGVMVNKLAEEMGVPTWGLVAIAIGKYARDTVAQIASL